MKQESFAFRRGRFKFRCSSSKSVIKDASKSSSNSRYVCIGLFFIITRVLRSANVGFVYDAYGVEMRLKGIARLTPITTTREKMNIFLAHWASFEALKPFAARTSQDRDRMRAAAK